MTHVLRTVGRYDLLEVIGRGGAAVVYLANQRDLERRVALKELAPIRASDTSFAERFIAESRLAGSLSHPNVVTVHEFFESEGVPYIAMEYLPHGSLRQYIGELRLAQVAGVLEGVLAGLSHGSSRGIVHRDLKPENLLVSEDGRVKIADFGVARAYKRAAPREAITATGATIGTPAYMAPEQALGRELTPAADLYALGVIAWEMLAGRVPFDGTETPVTVLYRHVHEQIPPIRDVAPDTDPRLGDWLEAMLRKAPEGRFVSADAAWEALEDIVLELLGPRWRRTARLVDGDRGASARPLTPARFGGQPRLRTRRAWRRLLRAAALAALAGAAVAGALAATTGGGGGRAPADRRLTTILQSLAQARKSGLTRLEKAHTSRQQGAAAAAIATAYANAARDLPRVPASTALRPQLTGTAQAYSSLAESAGHGDRVAYQRAANQIRVDERRLRTAMSRIR
jgi:hypothetical protein